MDFENATFGLSREMNGLVPSDDLDLFCAVDDGGLYVAWKGAWFKQPYSWALLKCISACIPAASSDADADSGSDSDAET